MEDNATIHFDFIEANSGEHYVGSFTCSIETLRRIASGVPEQSTLGREALTFLDRHKDEIITGTASVLSSCVDAYQEARARRNKKPSMLQKFKDVANLTGKKP